MYDVTDKMTFANIRSWITQIQQHADANVCLVLIGNKSDSTKRVSIRNCLVLVIMSDLFDRRYLRLMDRN